MRVACGGGGEGEGDDAHGFGGVVHAVAPAHVGGGGELEFAEDSVDPDWAHPAEDDVEEAHEEEAADEACERGGEHGDEDLVEDPDFLTVHFFGFLDLSDAAFEDDDLGFPVADFEAMGAVFAGFVALGGESGEDFG